MLTRRDALKGLFVGAGATALARPALIGAAQHDLTLIHEALAREIQFVDSLKYLPDRRRLVVVFFGLVCVLRNKTSGGPARVVLVNPDRRVNRGSEIAYKEYGGFEIAKHIGRLHVTAANRPTAYELPTGQPIVISPFPPGVVEYNSKGHPSTRFNAHVPDLRQLDGKGDVDTQTVALNWFEVTGGTFYSRRPGALAGNQYTFTFRNKQALSRRAYGTLTDTLALTTEIPSDSKVTVKVGETVNVTVPPTGGGHFVLLISCDAEKPGEVYDPDIGLLEHGLAYYGLLRTVPAADAAFVAASDSLLKNIDDPICWPSTIGNGIEAPQNWR